MEIKKHLANKSNYGGTRSTGSIQFIVMHYTANDGDTDENNGKYFANNVVKASAHYFVDDDSATQSVLDNCIAYSVGGSRYSNYKQTGGAKFYGQCTNANSISVEICDDVKNGTVYPSAKTISNALELVRMLMVKYNVPAARVIRHFDVNGKPCPAYWCGTAEKNAKWVSEFWGKLPGADTSTTGSTATAGGSNAWTPKVGETVYFNGTTHYVNSSAANGSACSKGLAQITRITSGKHPYHLKRTGKSGPYGWVDAGTFTRKDEAPAQTTKKSNEAVAREVIAGKWGNGDARRKKLEAAGYDYAAIQQLVNKIV